MTVIILCAKGLVRTLRISPYVLIAAILMTAKLETTILFMVIVIAIMLLIAIITSVSKVNETEH